MTIDEKCELEKKFAGNHKAQVNGQRQSAILREQYALLAVAFTFAAAMAAPSFVAQAKLPFAAKTAPPASDILLSLSPALLGVRFAKVSELAVQQFMSLSSM